MQIATWNVNSLNARQTHVLDWLAASPADVLCLQELKLPDERFPHEALREAGYAAAWHGQRTYNGVAILTRLSTVGEPRDVVRGNPERSDEQSRLITATVGPVATPAAAGAAQSGTGTAAAADTAAGGAGLRITCAYVPNGQSVGSDKYAYKLGWLDALVPWLRTEMAAHPRYALLGDFNIAPDDRDVYDPAAWAGQVLCSEPERERFRTLTGLGLVDAFRMFEQPERIWTWWDYRQLALQKNRGLRIDHILVSDALAASVRAVTVDKVPRKWPKASDHAPVVAVLG